VAEHGLAIHIAREGRNLLFDTGQGLALRSNSNALKIDLANLDALILSHGHDDHTGGLGEFFRLRQNRHLSIFAHPDIFTPKFRIAPGTKPVEIGLRWTKEELEKLGAVFQLSAKPREIYPGIWLTGEIPRKNNFETIDPGLYTVTEAGMVPDLLLDDQALVIVEPAGLVIILGCAHSGLINTIEHAQKITGVTAIDTVIGGTHLLRATAEQMEATVWHLKRIGVKRLGVSHCTGFEAAARFKRALGEGFFLNNVGSRVVI